MLKVRQVKVEVIADNEDMRLKALMKKMKLSKEEIIDYEIVKQSLDARDKNSIFYVYEFDVNIKNKQFYLRRNQNRDISLTLNQKYKLVKSGNIKLKNKIVIVGSGPAGLFAAYILAENGYKPLVVERGKKVEEREKDVEKFWQDGILNPDSNVQFGEGGAGTFSDGKLNTLVKDESNRMKKVFETFVECGAPKEILYSYKPHVGTDKLREVIINMRNKIIAMGGEFLYETCLTDIVKKENEIKEIIVNNEKKIACDALVLAIGHSARDTFEMLYEKGIEMVNKPFAVGIRVQHLQKEINKSQYGEKYVKILGACSYKLTHKTASGRGVYTFCMCPGGFVVNASSEKGHLAINGMSNHARDEKNANSAVIVTIDANDFGNHPLDGIKYQRDLERKAYELGKGSIPVQLLKDFNNNKISSNFGSILPVMKGKTVFANLNSLFSANINDSLKEAMCAFGKKIKGYDNPDTILAGVESRTSSPVKIIRTDSFQANVKGIFPCGEGAGYAGGITSAAMDGIKIAEAIAKLYI
ncbi:MAG: FAD-binding protein [Firmicutes bacterium]|nr:FAD-binding protein [Bacillota bacterium]